MSKNLTKKSNASIIIAVTLVVIWILATWFITNELQTVIFDLFSTNYLTPSDKEMIYQLALYKAAGYELLLTTGIIGIRFFLKSK